MKPTLDRNKIYIVHNAEHNASFAHVLQKNSIFRVWMEPNEPKYSLLV